MPDPRAIVALPGDPDTASGGYGYDRRVVAGLRGLGWDVGVLRLPDGFPAPTPAALVDAYAALAAQPPGVPLLVDGLALGAMPAVGAAIDPRTPLVALVHHPLAAECGLAPGRADALRASERAALAAARHVVTTSRATAAAIVADYDVPADRITVAVPGTDPADPAVGSGGPAVALLSVGALVPRKGHDLLLAALARLPATADWRLTVVGDDRRDPPTAHGLRAAASAARLADRVRFTGTVDAVRLDGLFRSADLFVLASRHEGYGMAYAEAVARGLPVVGTTAGAIAEAVPDGAGVLVPPDDVDALAAALRTLVTDPVARGRVAAAARDAAGRLPRWSRTVALVADALRAALAR